MFTYFDADTSAIDALIGLRLKDELNALAMEFYLRCELVLKRNTSDFFNFRKSHLNRMTEII